MVWVVALGGIATLVAVVAGVSILVAPSRADRAFRQQWVRSFAPAEPSGTAPRRSDAVALALLILLTAILMAVLLVMLRTGALLWIATLLVGVVAIVLAPVSLRQGLRVASEDSERCSRMLLGRMPRWFSHAVPPGLVALTYALVALAGVGLVALSLVEALS